MSEPIRRPELAGDRTPSRADYGLDAPGLVRGFLLGGGAAVLAGGITTLAMPHIRIAHTAVWMGSSFVITALLMIASSRLGKLRARDRLLDSLGLKGSEALLDVGCGRGLLLVGAAKRLPGGRAVGIDLWSGADLSGNRKEATLANAAAEGVRERVEVRDGDMRELPFEDGSFDVVVAMFAIHNLSDRAGRERAVREIVRVLAPRGRVALRDLGRTGEYAQTLRAAGLEVRRSGLSFLTFPPSRVVTARRS